MAAARKSQQMLAHRVNQHEHLSETQAARFYSSWHYSAIRLGADIEGRSGLPALAAALQIPETELKRKLDFLVENGLIDLRNGDFCLGPSKTHIGADSPFVNNHHRNWRDLACQQREKRKEQNLFVTAPHTLSKKSFLEMREEIIKFCSSQFSVISESKPEKLACLNLDYFELY